MPTRKLKYVNGAVERPEKIKTFKNDQTIVWDLDNAAAQHHVQIVFPPPPSVLYKPWPGTAPVTSDNGKKITAIGVELEPGGGQALYKYNIVWSDPAGELDPDIENNVGTDPDDHKPKQKTPRSRNR